MCGVLYKSTVVQSMRPNFIDGQVFKYQYDESYDL